ncbi:hypothetical protein ACU5YK_006196 [Pseudomonas aeruginosa]
MNALTQPAALAASPLNINLTDFIDEFGDELLESLNRSPPGLSRRRGLRQEPPAWRDHRSCVLPS